MRECGVPMSVGETHPGQAWEKHEEAVDLANRSNLNRINPFLG